MLDEKKKRNNGVGTNERSMYACTRSHPNDSHHPGHEIKSREGHSSPGFTTLIYNTPHSPISRSQNVRPDLN